jgi:hypothetical protein
MYVFIISHPPCSFCEEWIYTVIDSNVSVPFKVSNFRGTKSMQWYMADFMLGYYRARSMFVLMEM